MKEIRIESSKEFLDKLEELKSSRAWAFRGQSNSNWKLLPKSGREEFSLRYKEPDITEKRIFESWKRYAVHYTKVVPSDEWDWLSLAQHHGLATRLLDWTKNPLSAAFFAVDSKEMEDSAIYGFKINASEIVENENPFEVKKLKVYYPRGLSARVISQRGIFTISGRPSEPIESQLKDRLHKFVISKDAKSDIKELLNLFNINTLSIYQDLDNLSKHLNDLVVTTSPKKLKQLAIFNE